MILFGILLALFLVHLLVLMVANPVLMAKKLISMLWELLLGAIVLGLTISVMLITSPL